MAAFRLILWLVVRSTTTVSTRRSCRAIVFHAFSRPLHPTCMALHTYRRGPKLPPLPCREGESSWVSMSWMKGRFPLHLLRRFTQCSSLECLLYEQSRSGNQYPYLNTNDTGYGRWGGRRRTRQRNIVELCSGRDGSSCRFFRQVRLICWACCAPLCLASVSLLCEQARQTLVNPSLAAWPQPPATVLDTRIDQVRMRQFHPDTPPLFCFVSHRDYEEKVGIPGQGARALHPEGLRWQFYASSVPTSPGRVCRQSSARPQVLGARLGSNSGLEVRMCLFKRGAVRAYV